MAQSTTVSDVVAVSTDQDLQLFLRGDFPEPEERVSRRGVPDYRPQLRESRPVADIMESARPKILMRARMQMKISRFKYTPISDDQIRLLRIRPNEFEEPLLCDLSIVKLADMEERYEALSYCWGDEDPSEIINIHTLSPDPANSDQGRYLYSPMEEFPVRPNLHKALRYLRSRERPVIIWVDAICMDQRDTPEAKLEKDHQLSMMSEIYNSAKNVCIWLGDADATSKAAFKLVRDIMNFQTLDTRLTVTDADGVTKQRWCDFIESLKAPWFSRRWIIQEVALARRASVHFGDDIVHWDDLADAISLLNEKIDILKQKFSDGAFSEVPMLSATHLVKAIVNVCRKSPNGDILDRLLDLETLVSTFQQFHARFSEDIIHSVRSLAKDAPVQEDDADFRTNLEQEKSTRDLFIAFVNRCIRNSGSLDIICRHWAPPATDTAGEEVSFPTWVSALSKGPFGLAGESRERQNGENFVAMSPNDKRKRYSASLGYEAFNDRDRLRSTSIMKPVVPPEISISAPGYVGNLDDTRFGHSLTGSDLTLSPAAVETSNPFHYTFEKVVEQVLEDKNLKGTGTSPVILKSPPPPLVVKFPPMTSVPTPVRPVPMQTISEAHGNGLQKPTEKVQSEPVSYSSGRDPSQTPIQTPISPGTRPRANSSSTLTPNLGNQIPGSGRSRIIPQPDLSPNPMRQRRERRDSEAIQLQNSYVQQDKEHHKDLGGTLRVHGFVLGTVKRHSDVMRGGIIPGDWLKILGWDRKGKDNIVPDILWRLLVADRNPEGGNPPGWYRRACLHCLKDTRITNSKGDLDSHRVDKVSESMTSKYLMRVESVVWRRRIIGIDSRICEDHLELFGLAPEETENGDLVCILFGCSVPVVLRKVKDCRSQELFELIGEAYVHGMMDGEAVQDAKLVERIRGRFHIV